MMNSVKSDGICSFEITESNNRKLKALIRYAQMLDDVVTTYAAESMDAPPDRLNSDGLINSLLDDVTDRQIKALVKRHGFESENEFIELIGACNDGTEVLVLVKNAERKYYKQSHLRILSQIPVDDGQKVIPFGDVIKDAVKEAEMDLKLVEMADECKQLIDKAYPKSRKGGQK